jgi:hypothetical protein
MPNYRSLVPGGYFSSTPMDKSTGPVTIRMNNPGAINGAKWEISYPGYVDTVETTPGNRSTIFEAPEYGVGAWWDLLRQYQAGKVTTVDGIITKYGGGQDYSAYLQIVLKQTGFSGDTVIDLSNDQQVLQFGRAMFRYEAGRAPPWSDDQILYGIRGGRAFASTKTWPASPVAGPQQTAPVAAGQISDNDVLALLPQLLSALASNAANATGANVAGTGTASATASNIPAPVVLSPIDRIFGGEALVGSKTMLGVLAYAVVAILKAVGILGVATPPGQILSILSIALTLLGGLAKVDRMTQSLGNIAASSK